MDRPVGLDLDLQPVAAQEADQAPDLLGERLTPREVRPGGREPPAQPVDPGRDRGGRRCRSALPCVLGVAERAAEVAAGEPDEDRRLALAEAFPLDRGEDLNDLQNRWPRHPRIPRP